MANKTKRNGIAINSKELELVPHEKLLILRRRYKMTQSEAAARFKVPLFTYKRAEYGTSNDFKYPDFKLAELTQHEKCLIYRKRSGRTQEEIAKKICCSLYWFRQMETGKVSSNRIMAYWTKQ